ncbi:MAG TPA: hypothetical protein VFL72_07290 [Acidimicrobiia bacterium]|nr:hypothetical protein [Acidimicrobiia bacterium]
MEGAGAIGVAFIGLVVLGVVVIILRRQRKRAAAVDLEDTSWLRRAPVEPDPIAKRLAVADFHIHGSEARVVFDVPLPEENDPILNDLLVDEAVEVVREKRHSLPIDEVTEIVVFAGRGDSREIGRTRLPAPGQLPSSIQPDMLNLTHIARDPFARQFEDELITQVETQVHVPADDLGPVGRELRIPMGLERGLRTRGVDPTTASGPELIIALLEMFGYEVNPQIDGTFIAIKDNMRTFIRAEPHLPGSYPELDEQVVRKFIVEFGTSGAGRGLLISDKLGPFMIHDVEATNPRIRFVTRQRIQRFIDSMALG